MSKLEGLGRQIAHEQDERRGRSRARAEVRERFMAYEAPEARGARGWRFAVGAGVALAAAAAAALVFWPASSRERAEQLELRIGASNAPVHAGAWVQAPANVQDYSLRFSDGTRIALTPRTRMRVIGVDAHGAHLLLESGQAHVSVVPRPNASWRLSVGPFAVRVVGTQFDVRWNPDLDAFGLELAHGEVALSGCVFGDDYRVHMGQAVTASCQKGQLQLRKLSDPVQPAPGVQPVQPVQPVQQEAVEVAAEPEPEPAPAHAPTRAKAPRASSAEPTEDAASEDERALLLIRRRFAGTSRAAVAAFSLGRLEFDKRHEHAKAAQWFGTYLKEQPRGSLAREARGRLIEATLAAGDRSRARALAAEYLELHPSGPHAELAQSLVAP